MSERIIIDDFDGAFSAFLTYIANIRLNICITIQFTVDEVCASTISHSTVEGVLNEDDSSRWTNSVECLFDADFVTRCCIEQQLTKTIYIYMQHRLHVK